MTGSRRATTVAAVLALALTIVACSSSPGISTTSDPDVDPDSVIAESVLLLPGEPTAPVQSIALTRHYDQGLSSTVYELVRLDGTSDTPVWRTPPLGDETYQVPLASDGSRVLTAIKDKVYAFDLGNGTPLWEAKLTDIFQTSCENCFDVIGGHLIVRSFDSVIHGVNTTNGTIDWSYRLEDVSAGSRVVGSHLLLFDGSGDGATASIIDPATGATLAGLPATCTGQDEYSWPEPVTDDAVMLPSSSEANMAYLGYGLVPACWQKWNLATGTQTWDTLLPDDYLDGDVVTVLTEPTLTFSTRNPSLAQLDTNSGAGAVIPMPADMTITPIARVGNNVIARAVSTRGTPKWSIVSIDATSGAIAWTTSLDDAMPVDDYGSSSVSSGETDFIDHVDGDTLRLVLLNGDGGVATQKISLADGSTSGRTPVASATDETFPSFASIAWRGPNAIVVAYDQLMVIDTNSSSISWSY